VERQPAHRGREHYAELSIDRETITAVATPPGRGGVAIVRVSGPAVTRIATRLLGLLPQPRAAHFARWTDAAGEPLDFGLALFFPAPNSFTGEDVLELHGHGGTVLVEALLEHLVALGARRARPGEFSERAFLNDKLDLAQAEAVADLIDAGSRAAARAALRSLQGEFSARVHALRDRLVGLRVQVEAGIDFPDEQLDVAALSQLRAKTDALRSDLAMLLQASAHGRVLTEGLTLVIAGWPNAGKSTLLNRLAGHDAAIVTPLPGTTRDLLRERVVIGGVPMELIDTAGLREASPDVIEQEGMRRARGAIGTADHVLYVVDAAQDPVARGFAHERETLPADVPVILLLNKIDQLGSREMLPTQAMPGAEAVLAISADTGEGLDALRTHLAALAGPSDGAGASFSARARHVEAMARAGTHVDAARTHLEAPQLELAAEELRLAQRAMGEVVGELSSDELLGEIFSRFCVGK
jgi:tRNA modification GTPase